MSQRALVADASPALCRYVTSCLRSVVRFPIASVHTSGEFREQTESGSARSGLVAPTLIVVGGAFAALARAELERMALVGTVVVAVGQPSAFGVGAPLRGVTWVPRPREGTPFDGAAFAESVRLLLPPTASPKGSSTGRPQRGAAGVAPSLVAIAASTGGTEAVGDVIDSLPSDSPPIVVVQHMPAYSDELVAGQWAARTRMRVKLAEEGEPLLHGVMYVARANTHLTVAQTRGGMAVQVGPRLAAGGHCPSADLLFESVAKVQARTLGIVLTGMGDDGARGLLALRRAGADTWAEHQSTCKVYGMPRAAVEAGAVAESLTRPVLARRLAKWIQDAAPVFRAG